MSPLSWKKLAISYELTNIFTARIPKDVGRLCFHRCLSVHRWGGGRGTPVRPVARDPLDRIGGTCQLPLPPGKQPGRVCSADGMPLAFTRRAFLLTKCISLYLPDRCLRYKQQLLTVLFTESFLLANMSLSCESFCAASDHSASDKSRKSRTTYNVKPWYLLKLILK